MCNRDSLESVVLKCFGDDVEDANLIDIICLYLPFIFSVVELLVVIISR